MSDDAEKKTIKFQMMLSESEAAAIDDWGFSNRIRSRAEAIRRLCQMGIAYDVDEIRHIPGRLAANSKETIDIAHRIVEASRRPGNEHLLEIVDRLIKVGVDYLDLLNEVQAPIVKAAATHQIEDVDQIVDSLNAVEKAVNEATSGSREALSVLPESKFSKTKPSGTEG
jgi:hypothetical protein